MPKSSEIRSPRSSAELKALTDIIIEAFAAPTADVPKWLESMGNANLRVYPLEREIAGAMIVLPVGQWFGRRSVPMTGVAAVAVAPQYRAQGIATQMMASALREMREAGQALSTLYPATVPLYRRAGYELAGEVHEISVPMRDIVERDRVLTVRALTSDDAPAVREVYTQRAQRTSGNLDRSDYFWRRLWQPISTDPVWCFGAWRGSELEGYLFYFEKRGDTPRYGLQIADFVFVTADAGRRLLTFLADHRTMGGIASWSGTPADPLMLVLEEHTYQSRLRGQWMLRIVDVARALGERGYPQGFEARIDFEIQDDVLPDNTGRFVLDISGGRGQVRCGGRGQVRLTIRSLAPLYTGRMSPFDLAAVGLLDASPTQIGRLATVFAGPAPWMADTF